MMNSTKRAAKAVVVTMLLLLAAASMVFAAGKKEGGKRTLVLSTWGLSEEALQRDAYRPFEEANNCEIVLEHGDTAPRFTKLRDNPNSTIDVIELNQKTSADGYGLGVFAKVDYDEVPNAKQLIPGAAAMIKNGYGPAYTLNSIGIIYNPKATGFEIKEWADLWRPELKGKVSIPEITTTFGPAMVCVAADYAGVNVATDQGAAAFKALAELKPNLKTTYARSADLVNLFSSGEVVAAVMGDFGVPGILRVNSDAVFIVPQSGTYANFNTIDITASSKNKDLAQAYINWRLSAECQSKTVISVNEAPTNSTVTLTPEQSRYITYGPVAQRAKAVDFTVVNPLLSTWVDTWTRTVNLK
jgi:putative spermidine/putrescine transport system substrate-binding protein